MPPVQWPLRNRRPAIDVTLPRAKGKKRRRLLADTGAGSDQEVFELLLREADCQGPADTLIGQVHLVGAYLGLFNVYSIDIRIPKLTFADSVAVVGVPNVPNGFDGIACFKFLNRFNYGNFGDFDFFGLKK